MVRLCAALAAVMLGTCLNLLAQQLPSDVGSVVSGFQDDFDGATLNSSWVVRGQNVYSVSGGSLRVTPAAGDPNHLLYEAAGYDANVHEVLARIRVLNFGSGDGPRGGIAAAVSSASSQGINYFFRNEPSAGQYHMELLDDARAWGPEQPFAWQNNTWYWLRLRHDPNSASQGGVNDVFGKIWPADGSTAEPANWQLAWDYIPTRTARTGFAGIAASSAGGTAEFEVDYVLIKAGGLPSVTVAPRAFVQTPVAITNQPQSQTVLQCRTATFSVSATGNPLPTFQWQRNGTNLAWATNASLVISNASASDAAPYRAIAANVVTGVTMYVTSAVAVLTISADTAPPVALRAQSLALTQVQVSFSEPVASGTATVAANYTITNNSGVVAVNTAAIDSTGTNVVLTCGTLVEGAVYTVVLRNITDACTGANTIAQDTTVQFTASSYAAQSVGGALPQGSTVPVPGGYDVSGGGSDISGTTDQFHFAWQQRTGDFDVKVRVASLGLSDVWAKAGLMVRESVDAGSRFAMAVATPSISGCYFQARTTPSGAALTAGSFPANYPNTWLRLKRAGNVFTGYAGYDGQNWSQLGSVSMVIPATALFGFAVASHSEGELTTAAFRNIETVTSAGTNVLTARAEPLSQSSRRTSLVISEIMFHPRARTDGRKGEFVEIFNSLSEPQDISGFRLSGEVDYQFPTNTIIPGGGFLVVARMPADLQAIYGITGALGPFAGTNSLSNRAGTIRLRHRTGAVLLEANYGSESPYPAAAAGAGHSLILARPSLGEREPRAWTASDMVGGSPGRLDPITSDPLREVVINEFLANTDLPEVDYIELYNRSGTALDLSGCTLSDDPATNKFVFAPGTTIGPRGYLALSETNLNFALGANGEAIYLRNQNGSKVLDALAFGAQQNGIASGRIPNGGDVIQRLADKTPGGSNAPALRSDIVINEIMYHPISENDDDEYVELYNRGTNVVDLYQWKLMDGVEFTFNTHLQIAPGGYVVVARNRTNLLARYAALSLANTVGNYGGSLANSGERLALSMPLFETGTNASGAITNLTHTVVNEVIYGDGGRWGEWADGGGSSLELIDARADNRLAANWTDSDETAKAPWTTASFTGILDHPHAVGVLADHLELFLQGSGECVIDDVEILDAGNVNRVSNSTFQTGATGWTAEGTQDRSSVDATGGFGGSQGYRVRAIDRGDNQVNRIRTTLTAALPAGTRATLRAKVRWLRGHPELLLRLRGNWLEMPVTMTLPTNQGTPGARNSKALTNMAPAIVDVMPRPVLPAAGEGVVVSARISDPDGVASAQLRYRLDPSTSYTTVTMNDSGTSGDQFAGDGVFSGTIPGQSSGVMVAYYIQTSDGSSTATFPNNAPQREGLVRFGETQPFGSFPTYRIWMTQSTLNTWTSRPRLNNTPLNVVFVLNNTRVIYNAQALYAGSPYIAPGYNTPTGNRCGYTIAFPKDDPFLGSTDLVLDWPGGHGNEPTGIQEQMAYWIADQMNIAFSHRHYIHLHVNGVTDAQRGGIWEAVMQPASEYLNQWSYGDEDGDFYKIDRGFEFDDAGNRIADPMPTLQAFTTTNVTTGLPEKKTARYRFTWMKRAFTSANDYTNIFALVDAVNGAAYEPYTSQTMGLVDMEQWMRVFAFEHTINNFDSYGHDIGKNMYAYKPLQGGWQLYPFDLDWLMLVSANSASYGVNAGLFNVNDPTIGRMYNHPPFRRAYWRAYQEIVDGPLLNSVADPVMDGKYAALVQNGVTQSEGVALQPPAALKAWWSGRRAFIVSQLQAQNAAFTISSPATVSTNRNLIQISGTAPFTIETITFNGVPYPITWTSQNNWTALVPLVSSTNLTIRGHDSAGQAVAGASNVINVILTAPMEEAAGNLVINEVMYDPVVPGAEYVEVYNNATNTAFDLSGAQVNGVDYVFPAGTIIGPRAFAVLAKNRSIFSQVYGAAVRVDGEFGGELQHDGETISLVNGAGAVLDRVRYESSAPWPAALNGLSLQLVDARRQTSRVGNWSAALGTPGAANSTTAALPAFPTLWINEVQPENVTGISDNYGERQPWIELYNSGSNTVSLAGLYLASSYTNLTNWVFPAGASLASRQFLVVFCDGFTARSSNNQYHTSFRLSPGSGSVVLSRLHGGAPQVIDYVNYGGLRSDRSVGSAPDGQPFERMQFFYVTPGGSNDMRSAPLMVFINEWMASNTRTLADPADGDYDDWFELYNPSTNAVDIAGYYLTDVLTNKTKFRITTNMAHEISPLGYLLVWADDETGQNSAAGMIRPDLHVNFQLAKGGEAIGLFAPDGTQIEAITFGPQIDDVSQGRVPDGSGTITNLPGTASPRAANYLPNRAPVLEPIADVSVYVGQTASFTATATDPDGTAVSYSMAGAPVDALINSVSGQFTWTPSSAGDFAFFVQATDFGTPPATTQSSVMIHVLALPYLSSIVRDDNAITLTWGTTAGTRYAVDYKDDLNAPAWVPLTTNQASSATLSYTGSVSGAGQRFFRVRIVD